VKKLEFLTAVCVPNGSGLLRRLNFMVTMFKKHLPLIPILLLLAILLSLWLFPAATPKLGTASLLFSLTLSTYTILEKHKGTENARPKILKEVGVMVLTLLIIIFLGGLAAMLTNFYVSLSFGEVVGLVSALCVSLVIGYVVKKGMGRFI